MALNLFPKTVRFFELLSRQNAMLVEAADLLTRILEDFGKVDDACKRVNLVEVEADDLCREISRQLSLTFITPIDREDIYRLNLAQEDSINLIKGIATRARLYGFTYIRFPARKMVRNLREMAAVTGEMICCLKDKTDVVAQVKQLKAIKGECEMLLGTGLAELHDTENLDMRAVVDIMKWTQVYDRIELAVERLDDLADAIEEVVLKNA
ncbi:DUF47 domain-containing protein [Nitratidesulfovibrio termitidis]|uniref:DUF47 domain-containing protein n=1 Tax=Nitratidesulfovibrio termitidis TaxID=42252 RepID=UPI00040459EF|nr:DUF47 family protein [Nitratidesulfovibrio termitidis]